MIDYVKFDVPQRLVVANGKTEDIVGEGTILAHWHIVGEGLPWYLSSTIVAAG
jgi:hypothetical protein